MGQLTYPVFQHSVTGGGRGRQTTTFCCLSPIPCSLGVELGGGDDRSLGWGGGIIGMGPGRGGVHRVGRRVHGSWGGGKPGAEHGSNVHHGQRIKFERTFLHTFTIVNQESYISAKIRGIRNINNLISVYFKIWEKERRRE
jgi:hypothetical protein